MMIQAINKNNLTALVPTGNLGVNIRGLGLDITNVKEQESLL